MSEMLGSQYFLARNYGRAAEELETALLKDPKNKGIRRKLIVCYTQIGRVERALDLFLSLAKEDVDFTINTDPIDDDCPCPELVCDLEAKRGNNRESPDFHLILGMLWLYCNPRKSLQYSQTAQRLTSGNRKVKSVLTLLTARIEEEATLTRKEAL